MMLTELAIIVSRSGFRARIEKGYRREAQKNSIYSCVIAKASTFI